MNRDNFRRERFCGNKAFNVSSHTAVKKTRKEQQRETAMSIPFLPPFLVLFLSLSLELFWGARESHRPLQFFESVSTTRNKKGADLIFHAQMLLAQGNSHGKRLCSGAVVPAQIKGRSSRHQKVSNWWHKSPWSAFFFHSQHQRLQAFAFLETEMTGKG